MSVRRDFRAVLNELQNQPTANQDCPVFRCQNVYFASFAIAANQLKYRSAELAANSTDVEFIFDDPDNRGPDLLARYNAGFGQPPVNARVLFEVRSYLLAQVKRLQAGVDRGRL